jgi:hypothetical protein
MKLANFKVFSEIQALASLDLKYPSFPIVANYFHARGNCRILITRDLCDLPEKTI